MDSAIRGLCANHPDRVASITCKHCGAYACSVCTIDKLWGQTLCIACDERGLARYPIPWDTHLSPRTFAKTCHAVFADTRLMFPSFPEGSLLRALGFAAVMGLLMVGSISLGAGLNRAHSDIPQQYKAIFTALSCGNAYVTAVFVAGVTFYLSQKVLRGRASMATCLRASAYLTGLGVMVIAALWVPIPPLAALIFLASVTMWLWGWKLLGQGRAGLSGSKATASGVAALLTSALASLIVIGVWYAVYLEGAKHLTAREDSALGPDE